MDDLREFWKRLRHLACLGLLLSLGGCEPILLQSGKSAKIEDTGFFISYDDFTTPTETSKGLPDRYYVRPGTDWELYKKVVVSDFTALTNKMTDISALQKMEYKTFRTDLPDLIAQAFDGAVFRQAVRTPERIKPKDLEMIKRVPADAVLMGNIKEIKTLHPLTVTQVEIKVIDTRSGIEILKVIDRNSTDSDKVAMPIVRRLSTLIQKAKSSATSQPEQDNKATTENKPAELQAATKPRDPPPAAGAAAPPHSVSEPAPPPTAVAEIARRAPVAAVPAVKYLTATKTANVRSDPNGTSKILGVLKKGDRAETLEKAANWFKVKLQSGAVGWIFKDLVKEEP